MITDCDAGVDNSEVLDKKTCFSLLKKRFLMKKLFAKKETEKKIQLRFLNHPPWSQDVSMRNLSQNELSKIQKKKIQDGFISLFFNYC